MRKGTRGDVARQVAVVLGAIFQVMAPALAGPAIGRVSAENPTLVVPADYAFAMWTPIFFWHWSTPYFRLCRPTVRTRY